MNNKNTSARVFLIGLLGLSVFASLMVFKSFIGEILVATILVTVFYKPYEKIAKFLGGRRMVASLLMCFLIVFLVIFPLANLIGYSAQKLVSTYNNSEQFFKQDNLGLAIDNIANNKLFEKSLKISRIKTAPREYLWQKVEQAKVWLQSGEGNGIIIESSKNIVAGTLNIFVSIIMVMFCMFFFFVDGERMLKKLRQWTPLSNNYDKEIFNKFRDVSNSIMFSTFATALAQGLIGAIGFLVIGFPVLFPSIILAVATIIPYVGTALVWGPIAAYLLLTGQIWQGIFLIIWGALVVGNSDNVIKAYLIKDKAGVHPLFIFFSIIGGLSLFGFWGLVYGPLIISLAVTVFHIYEIEFAESLE